MPSSLIVTAKILCHFKVSIDIYEGILILITTDNQRKSKGCDGKTNK